LQASGISPEPTELERLLEEIVERSETVDQSREEENEKTREKIRKEQVQAKEVRLKAMESLSEAKKRPEGMPCQAHQSLKEGDQTALRWWPT